MTKCIIDPNIRLRIEIMAASARNAIILRKAHNKHAPARSMAAKPSAALVGNELQ